MNNEEYDHAAFATDVEAALYRLSERVGEGFQSKLINPTILPSHSPDDILLQVSMALVMRQVTCQHFLSQLNAVLLKTRDMLIEKNLAYGNSALDPLRIFSKASAHEQLLVRLDDKISRIMRGQSAGEDPAVDMLGYLVLAEVAKLRDERGKGAAE